MIQVTVPGTERLETDLGLTRAHLLIALRTEIQRIAVDVTAHVKDQKLSGQVLKVQTGRLRRSINFRVTESATGVQATVGTNVEYARIHEFGFRGSVNIKAHLRKLKSGKKAAVRAHSRNVNLPERSFLRSTMREMQSGIDQRIARVVAQSIASANHGGAA